MLFVTYKYILQDRTSCNTAYSVIIDGFGGYDYLSQGLIARVTGPRCSVPFRSGLSEGHPRCPHDTIDIDIVA